MKVVTILGSPRKNSTSTAIAERFNALAKAEGATVSTYFLNEMDYQGCQGCMACKTVREDCALKDGLTPLFEEMHRADVVVMATPVYFGDVSAQFKGFIDRVYSLAKPDFPTNPEPSRLPKGKKSLFIISQGASAQEHTEIVDRYDRYFTLAGFEERRVIRDCDRVDPMVIEPSKDSLSAVENAARDFTQAMATA
ncbi:MAG: flavodoxin family protein [Desulfovibrio sp.]|nr:MAG: flavodoxin family protein [Desulfovibrio sp.]